MRKFIATTLLAPTILLALTACGDSERVTPAPASPGVSPTAPTTTGEATPTPSEQVDPSDPASSSPTTASPLPTEEPSEAANDKDAQVVDFVRQQVPAITASDEEITTMMKGFCDDFKATPDTSTAQAFFDRLIADYNLDDFDAGVVMGASTAAYCDEMTPDLKKAVQGISR